MTSFLNRIRIAFIIPKINGYTTYLMTQIIPSLSCLVTNIKVIDINTPVSNMIEELDNFKPEIIHAYPTILEEIYVYNLLHNSYKTRNKVNLIITASEYLSLTNRRIIKELYPKSSIIETYGNTECIHIANSCKHGTLHLNEDLVQLELIDEKYNLLPLEPGVISNKILLTNLINTHQILIRYVVEDVIEILPSCKCGSRLTAIKVHCRSNDIIYLANRFNNYVKILPDIIEQIFLNIPDLLIWQVIFSNYNILNINYVAVNNILQVYQDIEYNLVSFLNNNCITCNYKINRVDKIYRDPVTHKVRKVVRY